MAIDVHTIELINGGTVLAHGDRLKVGMLTGVAVPAPVSGALTGGAVDEAGGGYTSIPSVSASTGSGGTITPAMALQSATLVSAGTSAAPGDQVTLTGGTASQEPVVEIVTTKLVSAPVVDAGGSGVNVGDQFTLQGGAVVSAATVTSAGGAASTVALVSGGSFTSNITASGGLTQQSTTGSGSGLTLSAALAKYGANTIEVVNGGSVTALPSNPISQGSTTGAGTGLTVSATAWQLEGIAASGGSGYTDGEPLAFSGGGGAGAQGHLVTEPIGDDVTIAVSSLSGLPPTYNVQVTPNGGCQVSVTDKTQTGFNVNLAPMSAGQALAASAVDILVTA